MHLSNIEWCNMGSYGNHTERIEFGEGGGLWQLFGRSGSGKSTVIQMPQILIYGKDSSEAVKSQCVNWDNGHGRVFGTIVNGDDTYTIERLFSPDGLKVTKNGTELDFPTKKETENYIQTIIMGGLPFEVFKNVLTLSLNNVETSFVSLTASDKRRLIDNAFSMDSINAYAKMAKDDKKQIANDINYSNGQINVYENTLYQTEQRREAKKNALQLSEEDAAKEPVIVSGIEKITERITENTAEQTEINTKVNAAHKEKSDILNEKTRIDSTAGVYRSKIQLFQQNQCPTCGAPFNTEGVRHLLEEYQKALDTLTQQSNDKAIEASEKDALINELNRKFMELRTEIMNDGAKKDTLNGYLKMIAEYKSAKEGVDELDESIKALSEGVAAEKSKLEESNKKYKLFEILECVYSEGGVKKYMRERYIPTLNAEINEALKFMEFPYTVMFDNDFNAKIIDRGDEVSIKRISGGEKKRVDVAVVCALARIILKKYPSVNLMGLDETISNLDYETSVLLLKYLKKSADEMGVNIFVVSHTTLDESLFDHRMFIDKKDRYSSITVLQ